MRIVLEGLGGEESIAALCRREGIPSNLYYRWSKDFLEVSRREQDRRERPSGNSGERFDGVVGESLCIEPRAGMIDTTVTLSKGEGGFSEATVKAEIKNAKTGKTHKGTARFAFALNQEDAQCPTALVKIPRVRPKPLAVYCDFTVFAVSSDYWSSDLALATTEALYEGRCDCDWSSVYIEKVVRASSGFRSDGSRIPQWPGVMSWQHSAGAAVHLNSSFRRSYLHQSRLVSVNLNRILTVRTTTQ